jgi:8-oxo-dGTP pyrophosphatase MutT (NUDIX family)
MFERVLELPRRRSIVAAVCYRETDQGVEFLLVRTRGGRWTFPKGGVERGESRANAAVREAREEAGVFGNVDSEPFAVYSYRKANWCGWMQLVTVETFLCRVIEAVQPEESFRDPSWLNAEEAKTRLGEDRPSGLGDELKQIIDFAVDRLRLRMTGT